MNSGTLNSCAELCLCSTFGRKNQDGFCLSRTDWRPVECPHLVSASHKNEAGWFIRVFFQCDYLIKTHLNCRHQLYSFILVEQEMSTHFSILAWKIPWTCLVGCNPWGRKELRMTGRVHACSHVHTRTHISWFRLFLVLSYLLSDGKNFSYFKFNFLNPKISYTLKLFILVFKTNNKKKSILSPKLCLPAPEDLSRI